MRIFLWVLLLVVVAAVVRLAWFMVPVSGALVSLDEKLVDQCTRVEVAPGTEDVTIDPATRIAFVSASERRDPDLPPGGIYALDLDGDLQPALVSEDAPEDFRPHGISLWTGDAGEKRLFVISHPKAGGHVVEIFDVGADGALTHVKGVSFDDMHSPNDLVAVSGEAFYASNDRGFSDGLMAQLETYFALPFSSAVYWDGASGGIAVPGLAFANGINVSADGGTIYIAEFLRHLVGVYDRDQETGVLTRTGTLPVGTGVDNIEIAEDGALWIGSHPKAFEFLAHAEDPTAVASSQVVRVDPETGKVDEVLVDLSGKLSASSVGAVNGNTLVVGAVFDSGVLVCPLP
ncbi:MAG: strictosidine synthase family protein [Candidatus Phaeomarinobacter sp.]